MGHTISRRIIALLAIAFAVLMSAPISHAEGPQVAPLPTVQGGTPLPLAVEHAAHTDGADASTQGALPTGQQYWYWNVTIQGNAMGYAFQRNGFLIATAPIDRVATQNGINALDFWLASGNPGATPESGSIWFATNRAYYSLIGDANAGSQLDLAYVNYDSQSATFDIRPDPSIAAASTFNLFNAQSGLLADMYLIREGQMLVQFQNDWNTVVGQANLVGTEHLYYSNVPYNVTITGSYGGSGQWQ